MSLAYTIAKRIHFQPSEDKKKPVSKPAVRIAIIGIALGLAVMMIALAVVTGFKNEVSQKVMGFGSHIQVTALTNNSTFETPPIAVSDSLLDYLCATDGIEYGQRFATKPAILKTNEDFMGIVLKGVDSLYHWDFFQKNLIAGTLPSVNGAAISNEVLISKAMADALHLEVGNSFLSYFVQDNIRVRKFTITGIYNTGLVDFDKLFILGDIRHVQRLNGWDSTQVSGVEMTVTDLDQLEDISYAVYLRTANQFGHGYENPYYTRSIQQLQPQIFGWLSLLDMNMIVILVLMMAVAGFTMISGLLILILDKTQLIGTLKALGANNWSIRRIFLYQASFLIGKGMLWGNVIGLALCALQHYGRILKLDPSVYFVDVVPIELVPWHWLVLNIAVAIITLLMLIVPSHIIAKISPAKSIKFD